MVVPPRVRRRRDGALYSAQHYVLGCGGLTSEASRCESYTRTNGQFFGVGPPQAWSDQSHLKERKEKGKKEKKREKKRKKKTSHLSRPALPKGVRIMKNNDFFSKMIWAPQAPMKDPWEAPKAPTLDSSQLGPCSRATAGGFPH